MDVFGWLGSGTFWGAVGAVAAVVSTGFGFYQYRQTRRESRPVPYSSSGDKTCRLLGPMPSVGRKVLGRKDLTEELHRKLQVRRAVAVATGQGGIGKTTLARHYVETYRASYDGVLWARAEVPTTLATDLGLLAAAVKVEGLDRMQPEQAARALLDGLAGLNQDWLIVYDNVTDEKALAGWMPGGHRVRVLLTSRSTHWPRDYARLAPEVLPTGKRSDAGPVLLMREADKRDDPDGALDLARDLGGLPLALVAAGGLIRERGGSYAEYREKLAAVLAEVPSGGYPDSVIGAVKLSYDALDADARTVLDLFAWYAPEGLEARLLTDAPKSHLLPEFLDTLAAQILELCRAPDRVDAALTQLLRRSLLLQQPNGFSLHRLSAAAVRAIQSAAGARNRCALSAASVLATSYPPGNKNDATEWWSDCARLTPHVLALHHCWPVAADEVLACEAADYLFGQTSWYMRRMAQYDEELALAEASLALKRARVPESHPHVALALSKLGGALQSVGRRQEAVAAHAESVRLSESHSQGTRRIFVARMNHADALRDLGHWSGDRNKLEDALAAQEEIVEFARKNFGQNSYELAGALANLAECRFVLGDVAAALDPSREWLAIFRGLVHQGEMTANDARLADALFGTARYYLEAEDPESALPLFQESLKIHRSAFGRLNHPSVIRTEQGLMSCLRSLVEKDPAHEAEARQVAADFGLSL